MVTWSASALTDVGELADRVRHIASIWNSVRPFDTGTVVPGGSQRPVQPGGDTVSAVYTDIKQNNTTVSTHDDGMRCKLTESTSL